MLKMFRFVVLNEGIKSILKYSVYTSFFCELSFNKQRKGTNKKQPDFKCISLKADKPRGVGKAHFGGSNLGERALY